MSDHKKHRLTGGPQPLDWYAALPVPRPSVLLINNILQAAGDVVQQDSEEDAFRKQYKKTQVPTPSAQLKKSILDFAKEEVNSGAGIGDPTTISTAQVVKLSEIKRKPRFWYVPATIAASIAGVFAISVLLMYMSPSFKSDSEWSEITIRGEGKHMDQKREEMRRKKLEEERKHAEDNARKLQELPK